MDFLLSLVYDLGLFKKLIISCTQGEHFVKQRKNDE